MSVNKAITEIKNFYDWIVILKVKTEVAAKKETSLPGVIAPLKMDILTPNKFETCLQTSS